MTQHSVAENGGFCRDYGGFCRSIARVQVGGMWRKMADFVGIIAEYIKRISLYLPLPATHFLTAFLSALCDLCGKKSSPRFMASEYPLFYHSQNEPNFAMFFLRGYTLSLSFINNLREAG